MKTNHTELYDIGVDPNEQENISNKFPEKIQSYKGMITGWKNAINNMHKSIIDNAPKKTKAIDNIHDRMRVLTFGVNSPIEEVFVCLHKYIKTAEKTEKTPVFNGKEGLGIKIKWQKPGDYMTRFSIWNPNGKLIYRWVKYFKKAKKHSNTGHIKDLFHMEGKYNASVIIDHKRYDTYFEIRKQRKEE